MRAACSMPPTGWMAASPRVASRRRSRTTCSFPRIIPVGHELGDMILTALQNSALFASAALPLRVFPPLFNLYRGGQSFGNHVDNAIRQIGGTPLRIRTDLSATLFLAEPHEYDGGELIVEDTYGVHAMKLPAGHMVLYPSSSLHRVEPVTRGARPGVVLLGAEHGARRCGTNAVVRSGHVDPATRRRHRRSSGARPADRRLSQPRAALGRPLTGRSLRPAGISRP